LVVNRHRGQSIDEFMLAFEIAQLRHAYEQLAKGSVKDQRQFAEGLIAPVIRSLERMAIEPRRARSPWEDE
jgi:hypothetical protein